MPIYSASHIDKIKRISYSLILAEKDMITTDSFQFLDNANLQKLQPFDVKVEGIKQTPSTKLLFLPFTPSVLKKGDVFQVILYYTWEDTIIDLTDSTSYFTTCLFPTGVKKLVTNLVFTSRPIQVLVYKTMGNKRKTIIAKVEDVRKVDNIFIVRWEIDNPAGIYVLQRTLENWS